MNKKIDEYINSPDGNYALCQVVAAFVTFKTEGGYNYMMEIADENESLLLGH